VETNPFIMKKTLLTLFSVTCIALNLQSQTVWADKVTIDAETGNNPYAITTGLIDNDSFIDIIVGTDTDHTIVWYKGNGDGTFVEQPGLTNTLQNIGSVLLADLNGDGSNDIVSLGYGSYTGAVGSNSTLVWFENDGSGNFGPEQIITDAYDGMSGLFIGTIDAGSTLDIAITSINDNDIFWLSNDGSGNFSTPNLIDNSLSSPGVIEMKDIDSDGDIDAVVATTAYGGDVMEIFRNDLVPGGSVAWTKDASPVTTGKVGIFSIVIENLDGDANLDILATEVSFGGGPAGSLYWYEENGSGYTETILVTSTNNPSKVKAADLDNDGLLDIIVSSGRLSDVVDLVWFKNNGDGSFGAEQVINDTQSQVYFYDVADFDGDNDLDIASIAYGADNLNYIENLLETLSVSSYDNQLVRIFPNPTKNILNFEGFNTSSIEVSIFDILGKRIMEKSVSNGNSIDVSELANGVYTIKINNEMTSKFIKE
jgi:hypothetical protein